MRGKLVVFGMGNQGGHADGLEVVVGEAKFLIEIGRLVSLNVAARGVLAPEPEMWRPIEDLAVAHLKLGDAKKELRAALKRVKKFKRRDAIESAATRVLSASDTAYYYAGLAFGLASKDLASASE